MERLVLTDLPLGVPMTLIAGAAGLRSSCFGEAHGEGDAGPLVLRAAAQIREYFDGRRQTFDLLLDPQGSAFRRKVWCALSDIEYGVTISYLELARRVNSVPRAVGGANSRNPLPVIVPCHRVIAADGSLGGYTPDISIKRKLLDLEMRYASR